MARWHWFGPMEMWSIISVGFTCPDTYAPAHLALAGVEADSVAAEAEYHKRIKY